MLLDGLTKILIKHRIVSLGRRRYFKNEEEYNDNVRELDRLIKLQEQLENGV